MVHIVQGVDSFGFKQNAYLLLGKLSDCAQERHHVPGQARDALHNDQVKFLIHGILHHFIEAVSVLSRHAGFPLVRIDFDQGPFGIPPDKLLIVLLLELIA